MGDVATHVTTNDYLAFLVTSAGVSTTAVVSTSSFMTKPDQVGCLRFSPDGKYMAATLPFKDSVSLFQFNDCSGQLSDFIYFPADIGCYGLSFSPDNSKLYLAGTAMPTQNNQALLSQYDMSSGQPAAILASRTIIHAAFPPDCYGALQLAANNKIYFTKYTLSAFNVKTLGCIQFPNQAGSLCGYQDSAVYLGGNNCTLGLPNYNESYFNSNYRCLVVGLNEEFPDAAIKVYPNPFNDLINLDGSYEGEITLDIYDAFGRKLSSTLFHEDQQRLLHTDDLPAGLFCYRIYHKGQLLGSGQLVKE